MDKKEKNLVDKLFNSPLRREKKLMLLTLTSH